MELTYKGSNIFEVTENTNSKLATGDEFEAAVFMLGYPLYVPRVLRGGEYTPSYIAGAGNGLTLLKTKE